MQTKEEKRLQAELGWNHEAKYVNTAWKNSLSITSLSELNQVLICSLVKIKSARIVLLCL